MSLVLGRRSLSHGFRKLHDQPIIPCREERSHFRYVGDDGGMVGWTFQGSHGCIDPTGFTSPRQGIGEQNVINSQAHLSAKGVHSVIPPRE